MPTEKEIDDFLRESNAIEGVTEDDALKAAHEAWDFLMTQDVLTLSVIRETHKILMSVHSAWDEPAIGARYRGEFRDCDVWIGGRKGLMPALIGGYLLMQFVFETMRKSPPPDWKALHIKYEEIHPWLDGNGRTGRLFMNWTRIKRCGLPILIIKASERQDYYKWFR